MMKNIFLLGFSLISIVTIAQDSDKNTIGDFEKVYYFDKQVSYDNYDVLIKNIVAYEEGVKFALKLTNKTSSFIVLNTNESKVILDSIKLDVVGKIKLIGASKSKTQTIDVRKNDAKTQKSFTFFLDGLDVLQENETPIIVGEFDIPMTKKDFSFNEIFCRVSIPVKKSQKMTVKIEMQNNSNNNIIVHPYRAGIKMPDGKIYTSKNQSNTFVLMPQSKKTMTLKWDRMPKGNLNDMQKVDMSLTFNSVFYTATKIKLAPVTIEIEWDKNLTISKQ